MFDLIFESAFAFQSLMMLGGGLFCLGIGLLLSADFLYWRMKADRVKGRIVSFTERPGSQSGMIYNPVIEYNDRQGEAKRMTGDVGYGYLDDSKLGQRVTILTFPHKEEVRVLGSGWISMIVGLIFFGTAGVLIYNGARFLELNITALCVGLTLLMFIGFKITKSVKPKKIGQSLKDFKKKNFDQNKINRVELSPEQIKDKAQKQRKQQAAMAWVVVLVGLVFSGFGYYMGLGVWELEQHGLSAKGKVVEMNSKSDSDGTTYYPVVRYQTQEGREITFESNYGSNPPSYGVGDQVDVLYDKADPKENVMIDAGWWNWLLPGIFGGIGLLLCLIIFPSMRGLTNKAR